MGGEQFLAALAGDLVKMRSQHVELRRSPAGESGAPDPASTLASGVALEQLLECPLSLSHSALWERPAKAEHQAVLGQQLPLVDRRAR